MVKKRPVFKSLLKRVEGPRQFIQVLLGPRQVGKTTLALQLANEVDIPCHYASADLAALQDLSWLPQQWETARQLAKRGKKALLILDEIQKIPHWSDMVKELWDQDTRDQKKLLVMVLGSSPWLVQKGLTESLAGRFEIIPITHWSFEEMHKTFGWSIEKFLYFGGYPGAAPLADEGDQARWVNYTNDALIETTISRDVLLMTQVNKPILLRRLFQLGSRYSGYVLSYTKMLGELQEAGNTTTLAHYLELLAGVGLVSGLQKYAVQMVRQKGSSPKFNVQNTALMSAQSGKTFKEAKGDRPFWGRLVKSAVGAHLLNTIRGTQIELFYWREGDKEVDFVLKRGEFLTAIEVKSNGEKLGAKGVDSFTKQFKARRVILVGEKGIPLEKFLTTPVMEWVE